MSRRSVAVFLAAGLVLAASSAAARAADAPAVSAAKWLTAQQRDDGSIPAGGRADEVADATVALLSGQAPAASISRALTYIGAHGPADAISGGRIARVVLAATAAGRDPAAFDGTNYVARLDGTYSPVTGAYDDGVYANALAFLAVLSVRPAITSQSRAYLTANQCSNGGFAHDAGCGGGADVDTTTMCVAVLARDGSNAAALAKARSWLVGVENDDGGFPSDPGGPTNANSTGLALSALRSLGESPGATPWRRPHGSPLDALLRLQSSSGAFRYLASGAENAYATVQAIPGAAGLAYPVTPAAIAALPKPVSAVGPSATTQVAAHAVRGGGHAAVAPATATTTAPGGIDAAPTTSTTASAGVPTAAHHRRSSKAGLFVALSAALVAALLPGGRAVARRRRDRRA